MGKSTSPDTPIPQEMADDIRALEDEIMNSSVPREQFELAETERDAAISQRDLLQIEKEELEAEVAELRRQVGIGIGGK